MDRPSTIFDKCILLCSEVDASLMVVSGAISKLYRTSNRFKAEKVSFDKLKDEIKDMKKDLGVIKKEFNSVKVNYRKALLRVKDNIKSELNTLKSDFQSALVELKRIHHRTLVLQRNLAALVENVKNNEVTPEGIKKLDIQLFKNMKELDERWSEIEDIVSQADMFTVFGESSDEVEELNQLDKFRYAIMEGYSSGLISADSAFDVIFEAKDKMDEKTEKITEAKLIIHESYYDNSISKSERDKLLAEVENI